MKVENIGVTLGTNNFTIKKSKNQKNSSPSFKRNWAEHASWGANYLKESGTTNFKLFSFPDAKAVFVEVADRAVAEFTNIRDRLLKIVGVSLAGAGAAATVDTSKNNSQEQPEIKTVDQKTRIYPMEHKGAGVYEVNGVNAKVDDNYRYIIIDKNNEINIVKDPYAKKQDDILGWSSVYNSDNYKWQNTSWLEGKDPRRIVRKPGEPLRGLEKLIIDEVNIPTLSKEGDFQSAKSRIDTIAQRGVATAIELMPVENTYSKQWGYDGVDKFAVNSNLGTPEQLKVLVDYAHGKGLNVVMDMVPNHMGPDGNYLGQTGPYIKCSGEFGDLLNYQGENNRYVRDWMVNAALWWANEFKVDGIRLDLTKDMDSDYTLRQIALELNEHNPNVFVIAEDHRNKMHSLTSYYTPDRMTHNEQIEDIDNRIECIRKGWKDSPWSIGIDSEWDSNYRSSLIDNVLSPNGANLNKLDENLASSHYRVKYGLSHDEIGNEDGTRLIPKYLVRHFFLSSKVDGANEASRGQKAAQASQKLAELIVSKEFENLTNSELAVAEKNIGLNEFIPKIDLINAFKSALAKQKTVLGTVMTTPGPKMYFQGDDEVDLSQFKFFRELSGDRVQRGSDPREIFKIYKEKGYDTLEKFARPDSTLGKVKYGGMFADVPNEMIKYSQDLRALIDKYPSIEKGEISGTYKDFNNNIHIHKLKYENEETMVIKNYGTGFHNKSYGFDGFPDNSVWEEVFNSDDVKYCGGGYSNAGRKDITRNNQNLSVAPNSIVVLRRVK